MKLPSHRTIIFQSKCVYQELLTEFWQRSNVINYQVPVNVILMLWLWRDKMGHRSLLLFSSVYQNTHISPRQSDLFTAHSDNFIIPILYQPFVNKLQNPFNVIVQYIFSVHSYKKDIFSNTQQNGLAARHLLPLLFNAEIEIANQHFGLVVSNAIGYGRDGRQPSNWAYNKTDTFHK